MKKSKKLIFIDDSGDTGFKFNKGSSKFFVLVAIIMDSRETTELISLAIARVRLLMKLGLDYEFKFNKLNKAQRINFLKKINYLDFNIDAIVVDKRILEDTKLLLLKTVEALLSLDKSMYDGSIIKIDGKANEVLRNSLVKRLNLLHKEKTDIGFIRSSNNLIQLADMVAGSIRRSYESDKNDRFIYIDLLKKRIQNLSKL
jgi:hypothetical protein